MKKFKSLADLKYLYDGMLDAPPLPQVNMCNCVGPESGETKCPCAKKFDELEKTGRSGG